MAQHTFWRAGLADDVDALVADRLAQAVRRAPLFSDAPVLHVATPERRAREVRRLARESYPEGTPERLARELLRRFAPQVRLRDPIERDFDFFGSVADALRESGTQRRISRALVDQLIAAWKRVAQTLPPGQRQGPWLAALGDRGRLLSAVIRGYEARLAAAGAHDPEDAPWLAAELMPGWQARGFAPELVVIQDLDRLSPARAALVTAALSAARESLCILRGNSELLPFVKGPNDALLAILSRLGAQPTALPSAPRMPLAPLMHAWGTESAVSKPAGLSLLRPVSRAAEVRQVARQIKQAARQGIVLSRLALAFPTDRPYAELVQEEFTAAGIPFDSPFESALAEVAPVASLIELVRVARAGLDRLELIDALRSPYLPFGGDAGLLAQVEKATREAGITGGPAPQGDWLRRLATTSLAPEGTEWLQRLLNALEPFTARAMPAAKFLDALEALLRASGARSVANQDAARDRTSAAAAMRVSALHTLAQVLSQMRAQFQAAGNPTLTSTELWRALWEQAQARTVRPPEAPGERVRVLGIRELRGAHFDRLWLIGLTDQDLPLPEPESMFLPQSRQSALAGTMGEVAAAHLCLPVDAPAQADYLYACALAAADHVTLSYPAHEGETPFVPATPHARLLACLSVDPAKIADVEDSTPASAAALAVGLARTLCSAENGSPATSTLKIDDEPVLAGLHGRTMELARGDAGATPGEFEGFVGALPQLAARFALTGEDRRAFSPSQLDSYAECPQRFWSRYVMGVNVPEEPTLDTPANAIGSLLHSTFEYFVYLLRERAGQPQRLPQPVKRAPVSLLKVAGGDEGAARTMGHELIQQAFDRACAEHNTRGPFWSGLKRLMASGLGGQGTLGRGVLARFVDEELLRNAAGYGVRFTEFRFGRKDAQNPDAVEEPIDLPVPGGDVRLQGSVDRVDEGPEGLEIVDYKTGKARSTTEVRDGAAFQLPVYLAAISQITGMQPAGMAYLRTPVEDPVERGDVNRSRGKPVFDVAELIREKLPRRLARLVAAMSGGVFIHLPFAHLAKACSYCDFALGCGVRAQVVAERQQRFADVDQEEMPELYLPDRGEA